MRKLITSLILLFPFFLAAQQEFAPVGAAWYYPDNSWLSTPGLIKVEVTGIDTILGRACKRIESNGIGCSDGFQTTYMYEENGKVYRLLDSTFYLFIDFTAEAGQSWIVESPLAIAQAPITVQVDFIAWRHLSNGDSLREQYVSFPNFSIPDGTFMEWGGLITEKLGNSYFMFPQFAACDPQFGSLICYADPVFQEPDNCLATIAAHEPGITYQKGLLYPNPAHDRLALRAGFEADEIFFQDIYGNRHQQSSMDSDRQLNVGDLIPGIYIVQLYRNHHLVGVDKLIILR